METDDDYYELLGREKPGGLLEIIDTELTFDYAVELQEELAPERETYIRHVVKTLVTL
jgi:hypothetical protein